MPRVASRRTSWPLPNPTAQKFDIGALIVKTGDLNEAITSRREEYISARNRNFLQRFETIGNEGRTQHEQALHSRGRESREFSVGEGRVPRFTRQSRLKGNRVAIRGESRPCRKRSCRLPYRRRSLPSVIQIRSTGQSLLQLLQCVAGRMFFRRRSFTVAGVDFFMAVSRFETETRRLLALAICVLQFLAKSARDLVEATWQGAQQMKPLR